MSRNRLASMRRQRGWLLDPFRFPKAGIDCELLLHFDTITGLYKDSSVVDHTITPVVYGTGSFASDTTPFASDPTARFKEGGAFVQQYPFSGGTPDYNKQTYLSVSGTVDLAADEFVMQVRVRMPTTPTSNGAALLATIQPNAGNFKGFLVYFTESGGYLQAVAVLYDAAGTSASTGTAPIQKNVGSGTLGGPLVLAGDTNIECTLTFTRVRRASDDLLQLYCNELRIVAAPKPSSFTVSAPVGDEMTIAAYDRSTSAGAPELTNGFQGTLDEVYIKKGAGCGAVERGRIHVPWAPYPNPFPYSNKGWNVAHKDANVWLNNFGKTAANDNTNTPNHAGVRAVANASAGAVYWEVHLSSAFVGTSTNGIYIGIADASCALDIQPIFNSLGGSYAAFLTNTQYGSDAGYAGTFPGASLPAGANVIGLVAEFSTRTLSLFWNNVFKTSVTWGAGSVAMHPFLCLQYGSRDSITTLVLDADDQTYPAPTGSAAWFSSAPETFYTATTSP